MQKSANTSSINNSRRTVYNVDDDPDMNRSLHFLLETQQIGVCLFSSGLAFLDEVEGLAPAPIILDVRMPHLDGIQVLAKLEACGNTWPVIMLTGHGEVAIAVEAIKRGAIDFLEKPVRSDDLFSVIDHAFGLLEGRVVDDNCRASAIKRLAALTPREAEVVEHLCDGLLNKQVASKMAISPRTVEMHRANALRQLKVRTIVEAAAIRNAARS